MTTRPPLPLLLALLALTGCREDDDFTATTFSQDPPLITDGLFSVRGKVTRFNSSPRAGATVEIAGLGRTTVTDEDGNYRFDGVLLPVTGAVLVFTYENYQPEYRYLLPLNGSENTVNALIQKGRFSAVIFGNEGGEVEGDDGIRFRIPPGAARLNGEPYDGRIDVYTRYVNPASDSDLLDSGINVPGLDGEQERVALEAYGMAQISLWGENDQPITMDSSAIVRLELPDGFVDLVEPRGNIRFWSFDQENWQPAATLESDNTSLAGRIYGGDYYLFAVAYETAEVCGRLVGTEGIPLSDLNFHVTLEDGGTVYASRTDAEGNFCLVVPANERLILTIDVPCDAEPAREIIEPVAAGLTTLGNRVIDLNFFSWPVVINDLTDFDLDVNNLQVYADGRLITATFATDIENNLYLQVPDCDIPDEFTVQLVSTGGTSEVVTLNSGNQSPAVFNVRSHLQEDEFLYHNLPVSELPNQIRRTKYLMDSYDDGRLRHNISGTIDFETPPDVFSELTVSIDMTFPFDESGVYSGEEVDVELRISSVSSGTRYACTTNCAASRITITQTAADNSWIEGTYYLVADEYSIDQDMTVSTDVELTGDFRINR